MILSIYGRMVAAGEWRDYAIDHLRGRAVFSTPPGIYRRHAWTSGRARSRSSRWRILRRGHDLAQVLRVLERKLIRAVE